MNFIIKNVNMKKIVLNTIFLATLAIGFAGCLKDKEFEEHQYGINDPDNSAAGVGFPWASSPEPRIISVNPSTSTQLVEAPTVEIFTGDPAPQDLHVNLVLNPALIAAHNSDPDNDSIFLLAPSQYSIPSLKVTVPKGSRWAPLKINIPTTAGFDFSKVYGLGFTVQSVDEPGYALADNLKNVIVGVNVKNQYDAEYRTTGYFFHPTAPRALDDHKRLATKSATGLIAPLADLYGSNYYFEFDVSPTNTLINWVARGATNPGTGSGFFTQDVPNPGGLNPYPAAGSEFPGQGPWKHSTYNNTYNPSTKTFWMHYGYNGAPQSWTRQAYEKWVRE